MKARYILLVLVTLFCGSMANAQWLRKQVNSDYLYDEAKKDIANKQYRRAVNNCRQALNVAPKNLDVHLLLGRAYNLLGRNDSARIEYRYVIKKNPQYHDAHASFINLELGACSYNEALTRTNIALYYYPDDTFFLAKKIQVLNMLDNRAEANRISDELMEQYPGDRHINDIYVEQHMQSARAFNRKGYLIKAKREYEIVMEQDPTNKEAMDAIFSMDLRSGNYESSLVYVNRALQLNPGSYEYLFKKIGILQEMLRYTEAIALVQKLMKLYPADAKVQQANIDLRMESGRYYMNTDPYLQFQAVLDKQPGNKEALHYVINIATSRGLYQEALNWVNKALRIYAGSEELVAKKIGILESLHRYNEAANLEEQRWLRNTGSTTEKEHYLELKLLSGRQYMTDMRYDSAMMQFQDVLQYEPANADALNYAINLLTTQKHYDEALRMLDLAAARNKGDESFLFKKVGVLLAYNKNTEAAELAHTLLSRHPGNKRYTLAFVEAALAAGKDYMQAQDYDNAITTLKDVLEVQPKNEDALQYIINVETAVHNYDTAMHYTDMALRYYPSSSEFLFRKSLVYADARLYQDAYTISGTLYGNYPYNLRYRQAYIDQVLSAGRQQAALGNADTALKEYRKVLDVAPLDTNALYYTINILNDLKQYDTAQRLIQQGRKAYPANPYFVLKAAVVYENQQDWSNASLAADTLIKMTPDDKRNVDYATYLQSRALRNEISIFFLHSKYNYQQEPANIATVQYLRFFNKNKGSLALRVNYAGRIQGTGLQYELETYLNHSRRVYSYAAGAYSQDDKIFPGLRLAYSLFLGFGKGWELELGGRYLKADTFKTTAGVGSIGKYFGDFWVNLRGYYSVIGDKNYNSGLLTARYYFNNRTDYFTAFGGVGTLPDDRSLNFQLGQVARFKTVSVGAGFQKHIRYKSIVGLTGTWINQQVDGTTYRNQYDVYISLKRRF